MKLFQKIYEKSKDKVISLLTTRSTYLKKINMEKKNYLLLQEPKKILLLNPPLKNYSGLIKYDVNWLKNIEISTIFFIKNYLMPLFVIKKFNINCDESLIKNIVPFLQTATIFTHIIGDINNKFTKLNYPVTSIQQHVLVALFGHKIFKIIEKKNVNFSYFNNINILNIIESVILEQTGLLQSWNAIAINPNNLHPRFSYIKSKSETHQLFCDWLLLLLKNNTVEAYKDSKSFESGIDRGRLTLKANLFSNAESMRSYITKYKTTLQKKIKEFPKNIDLKIFYDKLLIQYDKILLELNKKTKNKIHNFINTKDINILTSEIKIFNNILLLAMENPNISNIINLGISGDVGINSDFLIFLEQELPDIDALLNVNWTKFNINILCNNPYNFEKFKEQIYLIDKLFFKNYLSTHNLLDYVFSSNV